MTTTIFQNPPLLLTEDEAAHLLNCSARTVSRMRQKGLLKFMNLGNTIRYPRAAIDKFIDEQAKTATA
ncbi:helix-turn-helix domain-containing protein [Gimesia panareensis]|uniref:helix-turn-helix domain-containing protein n=1 Tax=Gimesia panareensis TaxID=2527978 RepID=UPI00118C5554|nr:helix-turn-helix domain-containing protein [Gimesia panareensis]QDU50870.1 Helix-turn-helix domain protein [Gimesia panareensis]